MATKTFHIHKCCKLAQENEENVMNVAHGHPDSIAKMMPSFISITKLSCDYY
jgi:hypothetical protein